MSEPSKQPGAITLRKTWRGWLAFRWYLQRHYIQHKGDFAGIVTRQRRIMLNMYSHLLPSTGKPAAEKLDRMPKPRLEKFATKRPIIWMARLEGFEPTTPGSEDRCSCPLSYRRTAYRILVPESSRVNLFP